MSALGRYVLANAFMVLDGCVAIFCWQIGRSADSDAIFVASILGCALGVIGALMAFAYIIATTWPSRP